MVSEASSGEIKLSYGGLSDVGRKRKHNEDTILVRPDLGLFAVCDGMGGHNGGDVASKLASETLADYFERSVERGAGLESPIGYEDLEPGAVKLLLAIQRANLEVHTAAKAGYAVAGMGSTVVGVHLTNDGTIHIGHVGDSRCYRISSDEIEQVTQDHSFVNDVRWSSPDIGPENLARLPQNIITRALVKDAEVDAEIRSERTLPGDIYLLCSDGLSGPVSSDQMLRIIQEAPSLQSACKQLVDAANNGGGRDNVSVVLVRIEKIIDASHCPDCGYPIVAGMTFCVECGARVGPGRNG